LHSLNGELRSTATRGSVSIRCIQDGLADTPEGKDWWLTARKRAPKNHRRDFDTVAIMVNWRLWEERNARIFQEEQNKVDRVFELIIDDINFWRAAGAVTGL
jgi:hypothetical protein